MDFAQLLIEEQHGTLVADPQLVCLPRSDLLENAKAGQPSTEAVRRLHERTAIPSMVTDARTPPKGALELGAKSCGLRPRTAARAL